ncbi:hypothetical protein AB0C52_24075 [Streptomyces sp. NPDC048717]|uniref:hypothetical protein n=1 Tax=Streptomyces sp. NPDC048717 TaxID=3154928 RepID=UPI0034448F6D
MTDRTDPMLAVLRTEIETGVWTVGELRSLQSLRRRFKRSGVVTAAVVAVLRHEGLLAEEAKGVRVVPRVLRVPPARPSTPGDLAAHYLRGQIAKGVYTAGQRLPKLESIARAAGASAMAANVGVLQLVMEGVLRKARGGEGPGYFVADRVKTRRERELAAALAKSLKSGGWSPAEFPEAVLEALKHVLDQRTRGALTGPVAPAKAG